MRRSSHGALVVISRTASSDPAASWKSLAAWRVPSAVVRSSFVAAYDCAAAMLKRSAARSRAQSLLVMTFTLRVMALLVSNVSCHLNCTLSPSACCLCWARYSASATRSW